MFRTRKNLKILLLEARLDQDMVEHELSCLARSGALRHEQFKVVDMVKAPPTLDLLEGVDAVFIGGTGDFSVAKDRPPFFEPLVKLTRVVLERGIPFMGLCYGFHLMAEAVGGKVIRNPAHGESGTFEVELTEEGKVDAILGELPSRFLAQQGHNDVVQEMPAPLSDWRPRNAAAGKHCAIPTSLFMDCNFTRNYDVKTSCCGCANMPTSTLTRRRNTRKLTIRSRKPPSKPWCTDSSTSWFSPPRRRPTLAYRLLAAAELGQF